MKKILVGLFLLVVIGIGLAGYYYYLNLPKPAVITPGQSYVLQVKKNDITDDFLLNKVGSSNLKEYNREYVRIKATSELEQLLTTNSIKYILVSDNAPISNNYGIYIVKISDNYIEPKLQEISRLGVFIHKKYDWESRNYLRSTALVWTSPQNADEISKLSNIDYVTPYTVSDRIEPTLIEILDQNNSAKDIKLQIYDIYKYKKEIKNDPFYKKLTSNGLNVLGNSKMVTVDGSGIIKEYNIEGNLQNIQNVINKSPEIVRVFK